MTQSMENRESASGKQDSKELTGLQSIIIPVVEEHIHVGTRTIETGKVKISKKVLNEPYNAEIPVFKEEVIVERKPIGQYVDGTAPGIRLEGDITIIPVMKEVIIKRLMLVEELHITTKRIESTVPVNEVLRKEEVTVSRTSISVPE